MQLSEVTELLFSAKSVKKPTVLELYMQYNYVAQFESFISKFRQFMLAVVSLPATQSSWRW